ncbi:MULTISPECIES: amino acid adenylation domain-containing protein [unclassified Pseudomonas]|uniref:amino acid adenylation domain-containing protein n=1 Tax=unclassified Pseudomonas TaxID=196821 RepID=UPI000BD303A3|nr:MULTISPECIES: amino acid adenylation domain-containing protein [unclassified Pseudomonas]PVZ15395.1 amino acid adenylation domain-containing protein [Pseudomonas sp. URIL14HWK12:I12]PVZ24769.1 amino acid adenylation domain-containing protein [Pseudomonas sp. URIL14HWK12:I10]PVZ34615.1 amino acid adenylation domain-containing protein [Pseudomonas sp. URIL14HWK12:I11]SNZ08789.1 amino acid adenylation domain-containing protein [Pseudomonas sp. URIL14HWK12:I9]
MAAIDKQGLRSPMIHEKVAHWAALTPDALAVRSASETLTYAELDRQSSALASYLREQGIGTGSLVGVYFQPSPATLVCMLGILKSGAAYVPLDVANPIARLVQMIGQLADLKLIFSSAPFMANLGEQAVAFADIEQVRELLAGLPPPLPSPWQVQEDALCYTVFTSGTTGVPKAVAITHRSWANLIDWHVREYSLGQDANGILVSAYGFDISQRSLVTPLYSGASISLASSRMFDGYEIAALIQEHQVASIHLAPSSLYLILQAGQAGEQLVSLRHLFIGGEALSPARVVEWAKGKGAACNLIHQYGVAECTDVATCHRMVDYATYLTDGIPMGQPVGNCRVDVLDEHDRPVAAGETGQIVISGMGVGQGYLNNPVLQAERFRPVVVDGVTRAAYFTGDYARRQVDGGFICLGRRDNQIKIRGMLVNLSEIENGVRNALATVEDAIVLNTQAQPGQEAELTAFVTTSDELPALRDIGRQLSALLPSHMHPRRYVACKQFPLTQNGKIDRQALLGMG